MQFVAPDSFTFLLSVSLLVGLVVGGVGSIPGSLFGGVFVLFVPNIAEAVSTGLAGAIYGVILLLVIFVMPSGAAGFARVALAWATRGRQSLRAQPERRSTDEPSDPPHDPRRGPERDRARLRLPAFAQKKYDTGASDTEIKIGHTNPYSGPASSYGVIGKTQTAFFKMINEQGGVNGRKINFISYDDGYSPPKTVEQVRKLVESDGVLLLFNTLGTPTNTAIHKYCNAKKVPQLFVATGATKWGDPKHFPWTMGWQPNYQSEGHIYATYLKEHQPNGKIGILYQNDDYGKDYVKGLKDGLGDKAKSMIVAELPYETTDPTVDSQIVSLKACRRRCVLQCDDPEIRRAGDQEGGRDRLEAAAPAEQRVEFGRRRADSRPVSTIRPDSLTTFYLKDPTDPTWKDDAGFKQWFAFMDKYYPEGDKTERLYGRSATPSRRPWYRC